MSAADKSNQSRRAVLEALAASSGGQAVKAEAREEAIADSAPMPIVVIDDVAELAAYVPAWEDLARKAVEPNAFYEPWMLIPALKHYAEGKTIKLVLIFAHDAGRKNGRGALCGLFPLEIQKQYHGLYRKLPIKTISLWKHEYTYICTPLVRDGYARETIEAFFDWVDSYAHGCRLVELRQIPGDGPIHHLLVDLFNESKRPSLVTDSFTRAVFQRRADADSYMRAALSRVRRKEARRKQRRILEAGTVEYLRLEAADDVERWIDDFLAFEAMSWKGQAGCALACDETDRAFFKTVAIEAFNRGQLMMLALSLNGRRIAYKCNFVAGRGSFAFKIAFDEEFARYSPGVLLEYENIRLLHEREGIEWMDSCASPDRMMINQLWPERRSIQTVAVATNKAAGEFFIALIPMLRWLSHRLLRRFKAGRRDGQASPTEKKR
ncbi:MAG TPA: GNAT family N-acetyltransferase [Blastocatellia bacterium]|nr:GNAT family N-acetyltransferase [Blastocatellia bacterium]